MSLCLGDELVAGQKWALKSWGDGPGAKAATKPWLMINVTKNMRSENRFRAGRLGEGQLYYVYCTCDFISCNKEIIIQTNHNSVHYRRSLSVCNVLWEHMISLQICR